ncbi:MAG: alginate lyase family protein [Opitutales bacterium]|jgi:uncharacterized heparinase superfamily protein
MNDKLLYLRSLSYFSPLQLAQMALFRLRKPRPSSENLPRARKISGLWAREPDAGEMYLGAERRWRFLNREEVVPAGQPWVLKQVPILWNFNLNYFDFLFQPDLDEAAAIGLIDDWARDNPPFGGPAWRPYPLSLRIVNWIRYAWSGHELSEAALRSLALQVRYQNETIEYFLRNNHLWTNGKALLMGGLFFEGKEAEKWLRKGLQIFRSELARETLADGGNFELSPMYHNIVLKDQLDVLNALNASAGVIASLPADLRIGIEALRTEIAALLPAQFRWMAAMRHPDGGPSFFNDASGGIALNGGRLCAYAARIGVKEVRAQAEEGLTLLRDTGYFRFQCAGYTALGDVGAVGPDCQPGHAHADTLSMELSLGERRFLVNTGTSTYTEHPLRDVQRSTAAHNTLCVDGENSSEVWKDHRVSRRARIRTLEQGPDRVSASHDGYRRLPGLRDHERTWTFSADGIAVSDRVGGRGIHTLELFYHLHPDCNVEAREGNQFVVTCAKGRGRLTIRMPEMMECRVEDYFHAPGFGLQTSAKRICGRVRSALEIELSTRMTVE